MKQHAIFFNTALTILLASSTLSNPVTSLQEKGGKAKSKPRYNFEVTQGGSDSLICDVAITDTIDDPLDSDLFSFSVSEGEILSITVVEDSSAGANFQAFWRLLDSAGNPAPDCGSFTTASQMDCGPLPTVGNPYRIEVTDFLNDDTGNYSMRIIFLTSGCPPTSVTENTDNVPSSFELRQNYPNPFNPSTTIEFSLPRFDFVTLKVFNLLGEEIATLVDEELSVGPYKVEWDASGVASGIYIYRLQTLGFFESKKLILVK